MRLSDEQLASDLAFMRPAPSPEFAAKLDARAAEGFQRPRRLPFRLPEPRRMLAPAAAAVTLLVVVAVSASEIDFGGGASQQASKPQPVVEQAQSGQPSASGGAAAKAAPRSALRQQSYLGTDSLSIAPLSRDLPGTLHAPIPAQPGGGIAPGQANRVVESNAQLTLSAADDAVQDVADGVVRVTHSHDGIVMNSNVSHTGNHAQASFTLAIPSAQLQATLADLSGLAHVKSDSEGSIDITSPYVKAQRRLEDAQAHLASLKTQLTQATAIGDTTAVAELTRRIHEASFQVTQAQRQLDQLKKRAKYATVSVGVVTDNSTAGGGGWSFGDALHDAGKVLRYAAGIAVVSAAVLLPLALLTLLVAIAWRAWLRRSREAALGDAPAK